MAPKRATRSTPVITTSAPTATTTTSVTNAQLQAMIDQGVTAALAARDVNRNGDDSHTSGTGTEGVVELTQWFEMMETVFCISNCSVENRIKVHTNRFPGLALLCVSIVSEESDKLKGAVEMATKLMDKKVSTIAERQAKNKRKFENTSRNNQNQQQQNKRQNTGRAYTAVTGEKKPCEGSKPLCATCNYHHDGPCAPKCNKFGHFARDCRVTENANNAIQSEGQWFRPETYCASSVEFKETLQEGMSKS
ncbi:hypothetical protein Tco_0323093 [Tanacetum coccineum]